MKYIFTKELSKILWDIKMEENGPPQKLTLTFTAFNSTEFIGAVQELLPFKC